MLFPFTLPRRSRRQGRRARGALASSGRRRPLTTVLRRAENGPGHSARATENIMNDHSYVSLEQQVCVVCGITFDTGQLLLDRRLRSCMKRHTTTGWGTCPEHQKQSDDGFVALVECDPSLSPIRGNEKRLRPDEAHRTGRIAHLKRTVFAQMFEAPITDQIPCVFVEPGVIDRLMAMMETTAD